MTSLKKDIEELKRHINNSNDFTTIQNKISSQITVKKAVLAIPLLILPFLAHAGVFSFLANSSNKNNENK